MELPDRCVERRGHGMSLHTRVFGVHVFTDWLHRSGMYLRVATYSTAWIPAQKRATTQPGRILPKLSGFLVHRPWIFSGGGPEAESSFRKTVGFWLFAVYEASG